VGRISTLPAATCVTLESDSIVGRAPHCTIRVQDHRISNEHASLRWRGDAWLVRDLGSTNGSWLNGEALRVGVDHRLKAGDELAFGAKELLWRFEDDGAPQPMLSPLDGGEPCVMVDGVIAIPSADDAVASIFRAAEGSWTLEQAAGARPITAGLTIELLGARWRFSCPQELAETAKNTPLRLVQESTLCFVVSSDEEYVSLSVESGDERLAMGSQSPFYLLLILARVRLQEEGRLPPSESGWIHREDLMSMLRCGEQQLNVWVHRIRARFSRSEFLDYASIIERRDGSGQLRVGVGRCIISEIRTQDAPRQD
jgi:FHA domain